MTSETIPSEHKPVPPPGFEYDPETLLDYDEQIKRAIFLAERQAAPIPSFKNVPHANVAPIFNPTGAPANEIYARNRMPERLRQNGKKPHVEWTGTNEPVTLWRVVDRKKLEDGTGLVSSRIVQSGKLGDVEGFNPNRHYRSHDEKRMSDPDAATPFVSFSTDPQNLAKDGILKRGFGIKGDRDSVVVQVQVDPGRVLTGGANKEPEVLLLGGVAPEEYVAAYTVEDFVTNVVSEEIVTTIHGREIQRDQAFGYWALHKR